MWHAAGSGGTALGGTALQSGVFGGFGGSSYIDSLILRDRDNYTSSTPNPMTSASDGTLEERRYYCQNWRADVVAVTKSDGTPIEYVRYSAYGEPTVYPVADLNIDGVVNSTDSALWSDLLYSTSNSSVYADTDLDWDGQDDWNSGGADSDLFYESYNANLGLSGVGRVSSPGVASRTGYAGYQFDGTINAYHVRYRVYLPDLGRWTRRDPLGYVDGMGLYEYCGGKALVLADPSGTQCYMPPPSRSFLRDLDYDTRRFFYERDLEASLWPAWSLWCYHVREKIRKLNAEIRKREQELLDNLGPGGSGPLPIVAPGDWRSPRLSVYGHRWLIQQLKSRRDQYVRNYFGNDCSDPNGGNRKVIPMPRPVDIPYRPPLLPPFLDVPPDYPVYPVPPTRSPAPVTPAPPSGPGWFPIPVQPPLPAPVPLPIR